MLPAKDFFPDDAMAELWLALCVRPLCQAKRANRSQRREIERRSLDGGCVLLTPKGDGRAFWSAPKCRKP
jgi:hypothetical protein